MRTESNESATLERGRLLLKAACALALEGDRIGALVEKMLREADHGAVDAAIDSAKHILDLRPSYVDAQVVQGALLMHQKQQRPLANRCFSAAVEEEPSNVFALWYTAWSEMCEGKPSVALERLQAARSEQPVDSFATLTLAWLLSVLGRREEAVELVRRGVPPGEEEPVDPILAEEVVSAGDVVVSPRWRHLECRLTNPALRGYARRYGEAVTRSYVDHFLRVILGLELACDYDASGRLALRRENRVAPDEGEMARIPGGQYTLGGGDRRKGQRERRVMLRDFLIDRHPVTNAQWREFCPEHVFPNSQEDHPVVHVDYVQASLYARWRGKRLPSEAEWEAAARGPESRPYPWGGPSGLEVANCAESKIGRTTPVTAHPAGASPFGVMDMMGNAQEWVTGSERPNNRGPRRRIVKGCGFPLRLRDLFCWQRSLLPPESRSPFTGLRCALDVPESSERSLACGTIRRAAAAR